ncbi:hypothetical protein [Panacagrimonas sp.]|uniref:hypothetical protein n=1 Tax=Panacagrimonas sp. TaxID=2480088 RepID=UPI003B52B8F5
MTALANWKAPACLMAALALISFPVYLAWEWIQCQPFFVHRAAPPTLASMLIATLGDVLLTLIAYCAVAAVYGASWPLRNWTFGVWIALLVVALILSIAVETYALQTYRWAYTDAAPLFLGTPISVLPAAQLLVLFPLSFPLARALTRRIVQTGILR